MGVNLNLDLTQQPKVVLQVKMMGVYAAGTDYANKTYDKLFSNGNEYDVSAIAPSKGTFLTGFEKGAVNIYVVENRSDSTEEGMIFVEKPFLGFVFA